jgi:hypothetical protein
VAALPGWSNGRCYRRRNGPLYFQAFPRFTLAAFASVTSLRDYASVHVACAAASHI